MRDSGIEHQAGRRLGSDGLGGEMVPSAQGSTAAGFDHLSHRPIFSATLPSILGMLTMSCLCTLSYLFYIPILGIWTFSSLISVLQIVRRSSPRHSPPQTFTTPDVHHPLCKIRRSPPQTFTTPDVNHPRRSPPPTFTTPNIHHPLTKCDTHHPRHLPNF